MTENNIVERIRKIVGSVKPYLPHLATVFAIPLLTIGAFKFKNTLNNNGSRGIVSDVSYRGNFQGQNIRYTEHNNGNVLEVERGDEIYIFKDTEGQTPLNWEVSSTNRDPAKIESLEVVKKRTFLNDRTEFFYGNMDTNTLYGKKGKEFLDRGSVYMNKVREYVAQQLRKDQAGRYSTLDGFLQRYGKIDSTDSASPFE
ncbi:hypothetical protein FJZ18_02140 [Candidatus Pacearchaeota archaeon]|nr:hypothetical protein [Candidatus Pacearchaeota archaeon]